MYQPYTYRYPLPFGLPSNLGYHSALGEFPVLYSMFPSVVHFIHSISEELPALKGLGILFFPALYFFLKGCIKHNGGFTGILRNYMIPCVFKARISQQLWTGSMYYRIPFPKAGKLQPGRSWWLTASTSMQALSPQSVPTPNSRCGLLLWIGPTRPFLHGASDACSLFPSCMTAVYWTVIPSPQA